MTLDLASCLATLISMVLGWLVDCGPRATHPLKRALGGKLYGNLYFGAPAPFRLESQQQGLFLVVFVLFNASLCSSLAFQWTFPDGPLNNKFCNCDDRQYDYLLTFLNDYIL